MRAQITPQGSRGRRPWVLPVAISIVILGVAAYLFFRGRGDPESDSRAKPVLAGSKRQRYENRAVWSSGRGAAAPAVTSIRGRVYAMDGQPIAGARVSAATFRVAGNRSTPAAVAETNGDGRFELSLPDGSYFLTGEREGFGPAQTIAHSGEEVGLVLPKSGIVEGRIKDERGQPVTRFSIDVLSASIDQMAAPTPFVSRRFESVDGSYRIAELPDRGVFLRVTAAGHAPTISDIMKVSPGTTQKLDLSLSAGCTMRGVVKDTAGAPVSDVAVNAELRRSAGVMGTASVDATSADESDAEGRFVLENVPFGSVMLRAYHGRHAVSTMLFEVETCEQDLGVELTVGSGGALDGVVRDTAGKPVAGAKLSLSNRAVGFINGVTDAEGRYRFDKLPAGGMRLEAMRGDQRTAVFITIPEEGTETKDLVFQAEGTGEIRGRVTSGGTPLAGMAITAVTSAAKGVLGSRHAVTDAGGYYRITGVPKGTYGVLAASLSKVVTAGVEEGEVTTADLDIAKVIERRPLPTPPPMAEEEEGAEDPR